MSNWKAAMLWSSRSLAPRLQHQAVWCSLILSLGISHGPATRAAEIYVQPLVSVGTEFDSNLDYDPTQQRSTNGYIGDAATLIGIATPDSNTSIEPRLRYEDYPIETSLNRLEAMLDLNSGYTSARNNLNLVGRYDHLTDVEAENPSAQFNTISGSPPTLTETGAINLRATRDNAWVMPGYIYRLTPRLDVAVTGFFQHENFSLSDLTGHIPFNYYNGDVSVRRDLAARLSLQLEGYVARYRAQSIESTANSTGGSVDLNFKWSPLVSGGISGQYQRSDINVQATPALGSLITSFHGTSGTWGASAHAQWLERTTQFRVNIGRVITPSSGGALFVAEQGRAEYDRNLSERVTVTGAVLFVRSEQLAGIGTGFEHNYHRADVSLKWMMTRTLFLQGGYGYIWDKYSTYLNGATNERVYMQFGYQGLPRQ